MIMVRGGSSCHHILIGDNRGKEGEDDPIRRINIWEVVDGSLSENCQSFIVEQLRW
jgi:hypothetical protein